VAGFFGKLFDDYSDTKKYPFGPPSHIIREITDHPDWVLFAGIRDTLFYNTRFAFWIALLKLCTLVDWHLVSIAAIPAFTRSAQRYTDCSVAP